MNSAKTEDEYKEAFDIFKTIPGWKDADKLTKECAEKLLKDYDFYDDIDGVFCRRINDDDMPGGKKWVRDTQKEPKITANGDGTYTGEYRLVCDDDSVKETFTFVKTEDGFRLDELSAAD